MSGIVTWFAFASEAFRRPSTFFRELEVDGYGIPLSFSLLSVSIAAYTWGAIQLVRHPFMLSSPHDLLYLLISATLTGLIGGTVIVGLWTALTHVFVHALDGADPQKTLVATAYATAAIGFLGWTPLIGSIQSPQLAYAAILVTVTYLVYVTITGLQHQHGMSRTTAALAGIAPMLVIAGTATALHVTAPDLLQLLQQLPQDFTLMIYQAVV